jgi:hypothetical protein
VQALIDIGRSNTNAYLDPTITIGLMLRVAVASYLNISERVCGLAEKAG